MFNLAKWFVIGIVVVFAPSCAPAATPTPVPPTATAVPTSTPTPLPGPKVGKWEGKPSISFEMGTDGYMHSFVMMVPFGTDTCKVTIDRIPVDADGTFFFAELEPGTIKPSVLDFAKSMGMPTPESKQIGGEDFTVSTDIKGKFVDEVRVSGQIIKTLCGELGVQIGDAAKWSAEWKSP